MRDIVDLYIFPPDNACVLCVDEKSQIQAMDRTQPLLPMMPVPPERRMCKRGVHRSTHALKQDIKSFLDDHDGDPKPFKWTKTADWILEILSLYCSKAGALCAERACRAKR